jgi:hypothetical protein
MQQKGKKVKVLELKYFIWFISFVFFHWVYYIFPKEQKYIISLQAKVLGIE